MGGSSRPELNLKTAEEYDNYFINFLEKWRSAMNNLTGFVLANF